MSAREQGVEGRLSPSWRRSSLRVPMTAIRWCYQRWIVEWVGERFSPVTPLTAAQAGVVHCRGTSSAATSCTDDVKAGGDRIYHRGAACHKDTHRSSTMSISNSTRISCICAMSGTTTPHVVSAALEDASQVIGERSLRVCLSMLWTGDTYFRLSVRVISADRLAYCVLRCRGHRHSTRPDTYSSML